MSDFSVILPAAGQSRRFGGADNPSQKKVFVALDGRPVWLRTADLFRDRADVRQVIVVIAADDREYFADRFGSDLAVLGIDWVMGGTERHHSIANALAKVDGRSKWIAIHDAARPCATEKDIDQVFAAAKKSGAAILAQPVHATLKEISEQQQVKKTLDRRHLWLAQTPQAFEKSLLISAYEKFVLAAKDGCLNGIPITDDSQVVEATGHVVSVVTGAGSNIKITTSEDLKLAQAILKARPKGPNLFHPFAD
ncbi:MAG: 2-C-methyl-D-erythritol 4-phosphate cytidylyltransferase [Planctomycetaceae bacterium]|nr:2-C-methyl-D-erythritol 4-phosphate cytidylyltransferase [Planctomycetaceae bacterium]